MQPLEVEYGSINRAFSAQSSHYDADDTVNPVLRHWRQRVYGHVHRFLTPRASILELNAGTGIDAVYFAQKGHTVLATDISDGMISQIKKKTAGRSLDIDSLQLSFDQLNALSGKKFNYVFSNFGGLNCIDDLAKVTQGLLALLHPGAFITWVVMPRICPWEWTWMLKGKWGDAFRRFKHGGARAHIEGEHFTTYYHSVSKIRRAFGSSFTFIRAEGLGVAAPPPAATKFVSRYPGLHSILSWVDRAICRIFPFNRWGDHVIVTFQFRP